MRNSKGLGSETQGDDSENKEKGRWKVEKVVLDRHGLRCPYPTLFSKKGVRWLRSLRLGFTDDAVLGSDLALLEALDMQI